MSKYLTPLLGLFAVACYMANQTGMMVFALLLFLVSLFLNSKNSD